MTSKSDGKRRIAVLGGGTGAMAAVLALTSLPDASKNYSITVYQIGWRLGGKGASGRNQVEGCRIEEHGLHVWAGFYDNAICWMKECFKRLQDEPYVFKSFDEAFIPNNNIVLTEELADEWIPWPIEPPDNNASPGEGGVMLSPLEYLIMLARFLKNYARAAPLDDDWRVDVSQDVIEETLWILGIGEQELRRTKNVFDLIDDLVNELPEDPEQQDDAHLAAIHSLAKDARRQIAERAEALSPTVREHDDRRRALMVLDLGVAAVRGIIADGLLMHGFYVIDGYEASDWLRHHGAAETTVDGALVRAVYSYAFGYRDGIAKPSSRAISAAVFLKGTMRLAFTYKGSFFFKMRSGMGDTIFAPVYKLLKKRGVEFKFFHLVESLGLDRLGENVETIEISQQVSLLEAEYDPFIRVENQEGRRLDCWPSEPKWDKLEDGEKLKASGINFESAWTPRTGYTALPPLRRGEDFDDVILGISLGALPYVAKNLIEADPNWSRMVNEVKTTRTQSFQLWFNKSAKDLGWDRGKTILTAYQPQTDTWANMSNLRHQEAWPPGCQPESIAYFCGPMADPLQLPRFGDSHYPKTMHEEVCQRAFEWFETAGPFLFSEAFDENRKPKLDLLVTTQGGAGRERWDAQYFRANIDPTETYVLSVPGSTGARLRADRSGFDNLWLAGDWTYTGMNAGCVEAAVMSGLRAASGLSGHKFPIVGEGTEFDAAELGPAAPVLETTRAQNSPWPWSVAYGMAETTGPTAVLEVPVSTVEAMLPPGLRPYEQYVTRNGTHPVILLFARQRDVRPNLLPFGVDYLEFTIAVPWVRHALGTEVDLPPLICPTLMYLNNSAMIALGRYGYAFPKHKAKMSMDETSYTVRSLKTNQELISCTYHRIGNRVRADELANFDRVRSGYEQSMVNPNIFGSWLYAKYDFSLGQALMQPTAMQIRISSDVFGLPIGDYSLPPITKSPFGGFFLTSAATINNPLQSPQIKKTLAKMNQ